MDDIQRVDIVLEHLNDYIVGIIDQIFDQYYNDIVHFIDPEIRIFITKKRVHRVIQGSRGVIRKLDPQIKQRIAVEIRRVFDNAEDEYMHSVMMGKPNEGLGKLLENMGQIHWNGI